jgi:perosamine synthetase
MITTNNRSLAGSIRLMKAHGITPLENSPQASGYYDIRVIGYNCHLSNLNIGLLRTQLPKLEDFNKKRKQNAGYLTELLSDLQEVHCPASAYSEGYDHVYHLYSIRVDLERLQASRDELVQALLAEGIQVGVYYRPIHLFSYFREKYGYKKGDLPVTENVCNSIITLPMYPILTRMELEDISEAVHKVIEYYRC